MACAADVRRKTTVGVSVCASAPGKRTARPTCPARLTSPFKPPQHTHTKHPLHPHRANQLVALEPRPRCRAEAPGYRLKLLSNKWGLIYQFNFTPPPHPTPLKEKTERGRERGGKKTNRSCFSLHELARRVWKILINPAFFTFHVLVSPCVVLLIVSWRAHVSYSRPWLRDTIRANPIRLRGEAADPAWEPSKANLLPKHHKSCPVKWLFLMPLRRTEINIRSVMYCPLNYQRAQFTHDIHLDQRWSKVGSRDLQRASVLREVSVKVKTTSVIAERSWSLRNLAFNVISH